MGVSEIVARWEDENDLCKFLILIALKTDFTDFESWDEATGNQPPPLPGLPEAIADATKSPLPLRERVRVRALP